MQNSNQNRCPECEKNSESLLYRQTMEEGGDWIQGAIKHPGRCTPGSPNYDCPKGSPQWNLAQRFKHGDLHKEQDGGQQKDQMMQIIMAYAQLHQVKPEVVIQEIQKLSPEEQQQAMQTMVTELQGNQGQQPESQVAEQTENPQEGEYAYGGDIPTGNPYGGDEYRYDNGGNYPVSGATGLGNGVPYIVPALNSASGNSPMYEPLKAITGFMGLATALGGAGLGYGKAAQWAGNKILPDGATKNSFNTSLNKVNDKIKGYMDFGSDLNTDVFRSNTQNNIPVANNVPTSNIDYNKPVTGPEYHGEYDTMVAAYGGVLPHAQFGFTVPQGAPYAQPNNTLDPNQFPQNNTTDAFTRSQGQQSYDQYNNAVKSFANPFDTNNMSQSELSNFDANKKPNWYADNVPGGSSNFQQPEQQYYGQQRPPEQALGSNLKMANIQNPLGSGKPLTIPQNQPSPPAQPNVNADGNSDLRDYVQKGIAGAGAFESYLSYKNNRTAQNDYNEMLKRKGRTEYRGSVNPANAQGNYTMNVGFQNFQPGMHTPQQDFGTTAKYGGTSKRQLYKSGGEYQVSEDELLQLMRDGAEIEFINK